MNVTAGANKQELVRSEDRGRLKSPNFCMKIILDSVTLLR
jgi:hypothetical protein